MVATQGTPSLGLVSIVIPVYNGARFMREAIDSALGQTYERCEVIVVNDGSSDEGQTAAIAETYGDRIRYFYKPNGGCGSALNYGIAQMRGEYFSWLSHDDVYLPTKVAQQIEAIRSSDKQDPIVYGGYELIDADSRRTGSMRPERVLGSHQLETPLLPLMRGLIHGCALLIPKRYFDQIGVFDESLLTTQDYDLWFRFFRIAPLVFESSLLVQSRVHPGQDTHSKWNQHITECDQLWEGFLNKLTDDEMVRMEGSPYRFLSNTTKFLATTPYKEAWKHAERLTADRLASTKVSVIMPVKDRFGWAIEAMESVRAQSHSNWELIIVDDGSTEPSEALGQAAEADPRIHYVLQRSGGPAAARNRGLDRASGTYIAFLDSDDVFDKHKLITQLRFMEDNAVLISHTSYQRIATDGTPQEVVHSAQLQGNIFPRVIATCTIAMPTVMAHRSVFDGYRFPEANEIAEDVCLWIELSAIHTWGGLDSPLTFVRVSGDSSAFNSRKQVTGLLNIAVYCLRSDHLVSHVREIQRLIAAAERIAKTLDRRPDESPQQLSISCPSERRGARNRRSQLGRKLSREIRRVFKKWC